MWDIEELKLLIMIRKINKGVIRLPNFSWGYNFKVKIFDNFIKCSIINETWIVNKAGLGIFSKQSKELFLGHIKSYTIICSNTVFYVYSRNLVRNLSSSLVLNNIWHKKCRVLEQYLNIFFIFTPSFLSKQ